MAFSVADRWLPALSYMLGLWLEQTITNTHVFFIQVVFQTYNKERQARVGIDDLLIIGANITGKIYTPQNN